MLWSQHKTISSQTNLNTIICGNQQFSLGNQLKYLLIRWSTLNNIFNGETGHSSGFTHIRSSIIVGQLIFANDVGLLWYKYSIENTHYLLTMRFSTQYSILVGISRDSMIPSRWKVDGEIYIPYFLCKFFCPCSTMDHLNNGTLKFPT